MSPRPRTIPDAAVVAAALRAIGRLGPAKVTLADVAREAGLAPATLVQRFGSKRGLLLAVARMSVDDVDACFELVRQAHRSPLAALVAGTVEMARYVKSPDELANNLAFLQMDISDPEFHEVAVKNSRRMLAGYRRLLDEAVAAGELVPCDTLRLARAVGAVSGGSLLSWAVLREGTADRYVRKDVATVLDPYRRSRQRKGRRRRSG